MSRFYGSVCMSGLFIEVSDLARSLRARRITAVKDRQILLKNFPNHRLFEYSLRYSDDCQPSNILVSDSRSHHWLLVIIPRRRNLQQSQRRGRYAVGRKTTLRSDNVLSVRRTRQSEMCCMQLDIDFDYASGFHATQRALTSAKAIGLRCRQP